MLFAASADIIENILECCGKSRKDTAVAFYLFFILIIVIILVSGSMFVIIFYNQKNQISDLKKFVLRQLFLKYRCKGIDYNSTQNHNGDKNYNRTPKIRMIIYNKDLV